MKTLAKVALLVLTALIGLVGLVMAWAFLSYPAEYVIRGIRWGDSDVYDYQKFPSRPVTASPSPFRFEEAPAEAMVRGLFEQNPEVDDLDAFLEHNRTQAFIVIQDDAILYEKYINGTSRESVVTSFSIAKSFVSALIGAAIADGFIQSAADPITDYLPELAARDPVFAKITIRDLLRMSSGIKYRETSFLNGDDSKTYYYPDLRRLALEETAVIDPPGSYFLYNNYHPLLLGLILERSTAMPVADYLQARIWQPIGTEFDASWSLDSKDTGFEKMESGINARAIDFAKFGRLYLNQGNWQGEQVIPAEWVGESTLPDTSLDARDYFPEEGVFKSHNGYYGYLWWGLRHDESTYDFAARGNHGQHIYVSPKKKLIIVRNGEAYGVPGETWLDMFYRFADSIELAAGG